MVIKMQTMEAVISLLILVSFISMLTLEQENTKVRTDTSLYKQQLANDVWRVLYLRGDFKDFSFDKNNSARDKTEKDLERIGELTSFCVFISGETLTNCRGENVGEKSISIEKFLIVEGELKKVPLTIAIKK